MIGKLVEIVVMEGIAVLLFAFAYAIGVKHKMHLIAGYNEKTVEQVHDKPGLARFIARVCVAVGLASVIMPLVTSFWGSTNEGLTMCISAYGGFIIGNIVLAMLQGREYVSKKFSGKNQ